MSVLFKETESSVVLFGIYDRNNNGKVPCRI